MPKVLIADDEDSMRQLVARAIAMDGHETVTAQDGAEALEILTREDGAFDLLLTDIQMPVMDGIALALSAARDFPDLTILLMTGFADQRERASNLNALVLALVIWRSDMVRLLPQTAAFYKMVGFDVNLRGLAFKDVKLSSETVDGKQVLVIEGVIVGQGKKPLDIPRLRFAVRDAQGAEIYAWNSVLEQTVLQPGERAFFRSRLASPPPEGRNIDVRFFNRRDIAGGSV